MSMLDQMATQHDIALLRAELHAEMAGLRTEMADLRVELKTEMADLRIELKGDMADLRGEVTTLLPKLIAANIVSMVGVAGLVVAAAAVL